LPHLLKTDSFIQREKTCLELPTNEFIEQRGGSLLKAIDIIPLSVIQTEDSPDSISEGEEDCILDDGTEEHHTSRMEELREQNEHKGKHNSLPAEHHTHTLTHTHTHTGKRNIVFGEQTEHNGRNNNLPVSHHTHTQREAQRRVRVEGAASPQYNC